MPITAKTIITGVVGEKIDYSLSPTIHNLWYKEMGIDGVYVAFHIQERAFKTAMDGLFASNVKGVNITVPFKEDAFKYADILTDEAQKAQAVNCLYKNSDNEIIGHNTDGIGFIHAVKRLKPNFNFETAHILMIGAGGAASGIFSSLISEKLHRCTIINRSYDKAITLAQMFNDQCDIDVIRNYETCNTSFDLIIQTTALKEVIPKGVNDLPAAILEVSPCVIDINYGHTSNDFLKKASSFGCASCDGLTMLIEQARPSFSLFNGCEMPSFDKNFQEKII